MFSTVQTSEHAAQALEDWMYPGTFLILWAPGIGRTHGRTEGVGGEWGWDGVFISLS